MQIAVISIAGELGGTEQATLQSIDLLQQAGHSCRVFVLRPIGAFAHALDARKIPFSSLNNPGPKGIWTFFAVRRALRKWNPEAVILNGVDLDSILAIGTLRGLRAKIMISHDQLLHHVRPGWYLRLVYRLAAICLSRLLFCSAELRDDALRFYPALEGRTDTLHNARPPSFKSGADAAKGCRRKLGLPDKVFLVGTAGRLSPGKRVDLLVEMATRLPQAHFAVAGDGPLADELKALAVERGVADRMHWLGWLDDLHPYLACLDVFTMSSDVEAFGLVAAEAMFAGTPVIASVVHGGLKELIDRPELGVCLGQHDVDALVRAIGAVRSGDSRISTQAAQQAVEKFMSPQAHQRTLLRALASA